MGAFALLALVWGMVVGASLALRDATLTVAPFVLITLPFGWALWRALRRQLRAAARDYGWLVAQGTGLDERAALEVEERVAREWGDVQPGLRHAVPRRRQEVVNDAPAPVGDLT